MTLKQLAERMGCPLQQMDIELMPPCKYCVKMGGIEEPCKDRCGAVDVRVGVRNE